MRTLAALLALGLFVALGACGDDPTPAPGTGGTPAAVPADAVTFTLNVDGMT